MASCESEQRVGKNNGYTCLTSLAMPVMVVVVMVVMMSEPAMVRMLVVGLITRIVVVLRIAVVLHVDTLNTDGH